MRLLELGAWLRTNGDAIYGTRPWHTAAATTPDGIDVRFTQKQDALYAIVLGTPHSAAVTIPGVAAGRWRDCRAARLRRAAHVAPRRRWRDG